MTLPVVQDEALKTLVKGLTDGTFVVDPQRNIAEFNRSLLKMHAIENKEIKKISGSFCRDWVNLEICENRCIVLECLKIGAPVRFDEVKGIKKSGEEGRFIVSAVPIKNDKGEVVKVLEMHRDVTDEARIHSKYVVLLDKEIKAKEEAEKLVDIRTKELQFANAELKRKEAQLVHSEKMSSLGQMVAGLAHELNNPINFISGNVDVMDEYVGDIDASLKKIMELTKADADLQKKVDEINAQYELDYKMEDLKKISESIRNGSSRAADVITGLRTFSRLDEAQLKETDIHKDLDMTLMLLKNQIKDKVVIHKSYGTFGPFACFSSQLNQVYMNLLQNAIQAVGEKGDIWIRTSLSQSHGLCIEIQDSGKGIAPDVMSKIFDPFFTTKPVGEGTGLGLSVSYGIVEKHGGKIEVQSEVGKGTTFKVLIPFQKKTT